MVFHRLSWSVGYLATEQLLSTEGEGGTGNQVGPCSSLELRSSSDAPEPGAGQPVLASASSEPVCVLVSPKCLIVSSKGLLALFFFKVRRTQLMKTLLSCFYFVL